MEIMGEEKENEIKENLKQECSVRKSKWGANRADFPDNLVFYWPGENEKRKILAEKTGNFLSNNYSVKLYAIAFETEQYAKYEKNFDQKYSGCMEIGPSEVVDVAEDLAEVMIVPESLEWMIIFDHEGDISFNGEESFIQSVKDSFENWEKLSKIPESRKKWRSGD